MGQLYGDSTPFPYAIDFLEVVRAVVDCGVDLMRAQEGISQAVERVRALQAETEIEKTRLKSFADAFEAATTPLRSGATERVGGILQRVQESALKSVAVELDAVDRRAAEGLTAARSQASAFRDDVQRTVERFVQRFELPGTGFALRLTASEDETYAAEARMLTPFGLDATFTLSVPADSSWSRLRRVGDLYKDFEIHVPKEVGLFSKSTKLMPLRMDKLLVLQVEHAANRTWIRLGSRDDAGHALEVSTRDGVRSASIVPVDATGKPADSPFKLEGGDAGLVGELRDTIVRTFGNLVGQRRAMTAATLDGKPLRDLTEPQVVVSRLVALLAPIVQEIDKRSGASGELVLRRDLEQGHRDEVYVTKWELQERIQVLSPAAQAVFEPFGLARGPRSLRAASRPPTPNVIVGKLVSDPKRDPGASGAAT